MFGNQLGEFPLLLDHRPCGFFLVVVCRVVFHVHILALGGSLLPLYILPPTLALLGILVVPELVPRMVDPDEPASYLRASDVIHGQVCAPLVLVLQPAEPAALARLLVARELDVDGFAVLAEDGDDVAFREGEGQTAKGDPCRVPVVDVPRGVGVVDASLELLLVESLDGANLIHRCLGMAAVGLLGCWAPGRWELDPVFACWMPTVFRCTVLESVAIGV